jgi:hypothetical protein
MMADEGVTDGGGRPDRERTNIDVEMETIAAPFRADLARPWKALLKGEGTTITSELHELMVFSFTRRGLTPPPKLALARAEFGPKGRRPRKQHVPDRRRD